MCLDIGIQSDILQPSRMYICVDPFMRVSSSQDIVLFFNLMLARCMYIWGCLSKNNKRIGVVKRRRKKRKLKSPCRQGQELDTYREAELNTQTGREREKAKSNLNDSLLFFCTILNRAPRSLTMIYIHQQNINRQTCQIIDSQTRRIIHF